MKKYFSCYSPRFATSLVYMLQASEYTLSEYFGWFWRAPDLRSVAHRKHLVKTKKARLLLFMARLIVIVLLAVAAVLVIYGLWWVGLLLFLVLPILTTYLLAVPLWLGGIIIQKPRERAIIAAATHKLTTQPGLRIAIAGSYGKTSFKEMLATILAAGKTVAATPGNMNTPLGISRFIQKLNGSEEILIFEMGEYRPGDIRQLCELVRPQVGVITGVNEAHLSKFKTLDRTIATIFELADFVPNEMLYKNGESGPVNHKAPDDPLLYTQKGVDGWRVSDVESTLDGVRFVASKGKVKIVSQSKLLGLQQVGPLVGCIAIAAKLGLTPEQIERGVAATKPFEHRMEPRSISGAMVIDDTYNGNSDGVRAGLAWLESMPAKRRIYVTPGLVEQGGKTQSVHKEIGKQAAVVADVVILMRNSVTQYIVDGLNTAHFKGELRLVDDPQNFYQNITHFVAAGDVVLLQNDWPDSYV